MNHSAFSPKDAVKQCNAERRASRTTPRYPYETTKRRRKHKVRWQPGEKYSVVSYGGAIRAACVAVKVDVWRPNQLRHNAATEIQEIFGIEAARVILGHSKLNTTQIYAECDLKKASEVALKIG